MTRRPSRKRSARRQIPARRKGAARRVRPGFWRLYLQDAAALRDDRGGRCGIGLTIRTQLIRSAKNAITRARDRIHERRIVADDGVSRRSSGNDDHLAAMRLDRRIGQERSCADSGAIDHHRVFVADLLEMVEANPAVDLAAGAAKTLRKVVEINRRIRQRHLERESARETVRDGGRVEASRA